MKKSVSCFTLEEYIKKLFVKFYMTVLLLQEMSAKVKYNKEIKKSLGLHAHENSNLPARQYVLILTNIAVLSYKISFAITYDFPTEGNHFTFSTIHARIMNTIYKQKTKIKSKIQAIQENQSILT